MPGSVNNGTVRFLTQGSARSGDIYQGYASGLYWQAFLTLGDRALAVRVVSDVIADEYALAPARGCGEDDVRHRLAESVFRRCQQLASDTAQRDGRPVPPPGDVAGRVGPGGFLSEQERGALGLVLIGGLGHVRASRVLGICPRDMAALLRTALLRLAASSAAVAETAEEQEKSDAETRIRHGDHHGSCRSRARGDGGQVATGGAAVHGDQEDVTRVASRSLAASRPRAACHCHHVRPARGEWDAYAGVGPVGRYGAT
jgi:hypothetical protein